MAEYIDREALRKAVEESREYNSHSEPIAKRAHEYEHRHFLMLIDFQPAADVVEVVRCKDCKHGYIDDLDFEDQYFCSLNGNDWNEGNHFCSYGERRTDNAVD